MAELTIGGTHDMALNTGLAALTGPHVSTRSATLIQLVDKAGQVQYVTGTFLYDANGTLTGGTVAGIDAGTTFAITGIGVPVAEYAAALAVGNVFGLRSLLFAGDDTLEGSTGGDRLLGFDGDDLVLGGFGNDDLNGNKGDDTVDGGDGADTIHGGQGDDSVLGGAGNDFATGSLGRDTVMAGAGNDLAYGGQGDDVVRGGDGADRIWGDVGQDALYGDLGADTFFFASGSGGDTLDDFDPAEGDRIAIARFVNGTDIDDPADLLTRTRLHPDGQLVDLGQGNGILIRNLPGGELSADLFLIV
ncbi:calcium-binding protein [Stella sp.]|uniref:calcium-binding protein n=1 Tax=Stella sp. TaxID=2912054 RepID=UPI0035B3BC60